MAIASARPGMLGQSLPGSAAGMILHQSLGQWVAGAEC